MPYFGRIAYNTNDWQAPSGIEGKSTSKDTHEGRYGFGFDEWLFKKSWVIDGKQFGFIKGMMKHAGAPIRDVFLYTRTNKSQKLVGMFSTVEGITLKNATEIRNLFTSKGWDEEAVYDLEMCFVNDSNLLQRALPQFKRIFYNDPLEFINVCFDWKDFIPAKENSFLEPGWTGLDRYSTLQYDVFAKMPDLESKLKAMLVEK